MARSDGTALGSGTPPRPAAPGRVTIMDVARAAGVSRSTASRALTGNGYVATDVRERVHASAQKLGYLPDIAARHFKLGIGTSLGLLVSDLRSPVHAHIAAGVSERLATSMYTLMVAHTSPDPARQLETARAFAARRVEGMIITPLGDETPAYLRSLGVPVVEVDGQHSEADRDRVQPDGRRAGVWLVEHVRERGYDEVIVVIDRQPSSSQLRFVEGCREALAASGAGDPRVISVDRREVEEALGSTSSGAVAVLAGSPHIAEHLFRRLGESAEPIALAAFGDAPWMRLVQPSVTAVWHDVSGLGEAAAERLLTRLEDVTAPTVTVLAPVELVVRDSTPRRG